MEQIWAPWRMEYIRMEKPKGCFLCDEPNEDNDECNLYTVPREMEFCHDEQLPLQSRASPGGSVPSYRPSG